MTESPLSSTFSILTVLLLILTGCNDDKTSSPPDITLPAIENEAPTVTKVTIVPPTQPGESISGQYTYSDDWDAEGTSLFSWSIDDVTIADTLSFILPSDSEGKKLAFCVTPVAKTGVLTGSEKCSFVSIRGNYTKPTIEALVVSSPITTDIIVSATYNFVDEFGRAEGETTRSWKVNDSEISTEETVTIPKEHQGGMLTLCVTPVASIGNNAIGDEVCSEGVTVEAKAGSAPSIANLTFANFAKAGNELSLSYDFIDDDGDAEANSSFAWFIDDAELSQAASFTLPSDSEGKLLKGCVTPFAQTGTPVQGSEECTSTTIADIVITGELELLQTIDLAITGYTLNTENGATGVSWKLTDPNWPYERSTDINAFTITGLFPTEDAIYLIAHDLQVCIDTNESGEICLLASEQPTDEITGGLPTELDADNKITKRVISPVSFVDLTISGVTKRLHRPLNTVESTLLNISSGGSVPLHTSEYTDINTGIIWTLYDWQTGADSCNNQGKVLPVDGVNDTSDGFGLEQYYQQVISDYSQFPYSHFYSALGWQPNTYSWTSSLYSAGNHYDYYLITGDDNWTADTNTQAISCLSTLP